MRSTTTSTTTYTAIPTGNTSRKASHPQSLGRSEVVSSDRGSRGSGSQSFSAAVRHETPADHADAAATTTYEPQQAAYAVDADSNTMTFPAPSWAALRRRSSTSAGGLPVPSAPMSTSSAAAPFSRESNDDDNDNDYDGGYFLTTPCSPPHQHPTTTPPHSPSATAPSPGRGASRRSWTRRRPFAQVDAGRPRPLTNDVSHDYDEDDDDGSLPKKENAHSHTATALGDDHKNKLVVGGTWQDYRRVWDRYPCYRWYLLSHVCQHVGDWFVRVASLLVVERLSSSGAALAHLVWAVMLPKTLVAPLGGYLADRHDRRHLMIALDLCGAVVVLGYLLALQRESLPLLYVTTALRSSLASLYYPATTGIVPLLVPSAADLQLAATMNGWAWSTMAMLGGTLAGTATAVIGLRACYVVDCATFLFSALMMYHGVTGSYRVSDPSSSSADAPNDSVVDEESGPGSGDKVLYGTIQEVASYLMTCGFGWLVIMKASAGFVWGPEDIIGVQYATVRDPSTGQEDESATSWRTGLIFSAIGIGMLVGPTLSNLWTNGNLPRTIQRASWIGLVVITLGWLLISVCGSSFSAFLVCTIVRTVGSGMVWVNSTVSLQTLIDPSLLGRILSIEYTAYTLAEALSATVTGELFDVGLNKNQLALLGAAFGGMAVTVWGRYHFSGMGAAHPRFNREASEMDDVVSSLEVSSSILDDMTVSTASDVELAYCSS